MDPVYVLVNPTQPIFRIHLQSVSIHHQIGNQYKLRQQRALLVGILMTDLVFCIVQHLRHIPVQYLPVNTPGDILKLSSA